MDKTEKRTAEDILDGLEQTDDGYIHYSKVLPAMREYAAQELDAYKARLKETLAEFPEILYERPDILELIDTIK